METTIIRLQPNASNQPMVVRSATFEEAFGDYSELRGRGRARRKKRKLERIKNRDEVKRARQDSRLSRRQDRKRKRQEIRGEQQEARMSRRQRRLAMRQERQEARQTRKDTRTRGEQERENYALEQERYRESLEPQEEAGYDDQGYDDQGYDDQGYSEEGYDDQGYAEPIGNSGGTYDSSEDWATPPAGMYEDEGYVDEGYSTDDEMMSDDDSYFNAEGSDGKSRPVNPKLVAFIAQIEEEQRQVQQMLNQLRMMVQSGAPTKGVQMQIQRRTKKINNMKQKLANYSCADGDKKLERLRKMEIRKAMMQLRGKRLGQGKGMGRRRRKGMVTEVQAGLDPRFSPNKIVVPPTMKSTFDGEMITDEMTDTFLPDNNSDYQWSDDLAPDNFSFADGSTKGYDEAMNYMDFDYDLQTEDGRPVIFEDANVEKYKGYMGDDYPTPRTYEIKSNFSGEGKVVWKSIAIGVGLGVLALYLAKRYKILK